MLFLSLCAGLLGLLAPTLAITTPAPTNGHWVDIWTSMPQLTESTNLPVPPFNTSVGIFQNSTIRQTLHMAVDASHIRLRFSNAFGATTLPITAVTVALPANGTAGSRAIAPHTVQDVTFGGSASFDVPNGALAVSDPLAFPVKAQSMITVTMFLADGQAGWNISSHPGSRTTTWYHFGNAVGAANLTDASVANAAHWFFVSAVEAWVPPTTSAFAIVGDSITDGRGSDDNMNNRWPDLVLAKMQKNPATANIAVVNQAAGGNRILADGLGPNALGRIDRDVLAQSGVKFAMIFEGVNDIGTAAADAASQAAVGDAVLGALAQIATRVHAFGLPLFAATITPFGSNVPGYGDPTRELTRQRVNAWIRTSGRFDHVFDFDAAVRDPKNASQLNPAFNSGDGLHPNVAGYQAIADAFDIGVFSEFSNGVSGFV